MLSRLGQVLCWAICGVVGASSAIAAPALCKGNPAIVGECVTLHGRLRLSGDDGFLLWPVGTKRRMSVRGDHDFPPSMYPIFDKDLMAEVYGDFEVCPFTKDRPGIQQKVCIETASHLVVVNSAYYLKSGH